MVPWNVETEYSQAVETGCMGVVEELYDMDKVQSKKKGGIM